MATQSPGSHSVLSHNHTADAAHGHVGEHISARCMSIALTIAALVAVLISLVVL